MKFTFSRVVQSLLFTVILTSSSFLVRAAETIDPGRVREIAAMLPPHVTGFGRPITDRAAWDDALARFPELRKIVTQAAKDARRPMPKQPDSLYLEFSRDGNRDHWQTVAESRRGRIAIFTLAECVENKGHFIAPLEQTIAALCAERTWVLPAHDGKLKNFNGQTVDIELGSSMLAVELAEADYLLGDRLSPATRNLIHENLERRIFAPYRDSESGKRPEFWWMHLENNWNAVCLNGVTSAALATLDSREQRAWFIAVAEKNIGHYLHGGFTPDGYCVEGLGYWGYGFGNFILLAENVREATGGNVDFLARPQAAQPALFGVRSEIQDGVYTSIADCNPEEKPAPPLMNFICRRFGLDLSAWQTTKLSGTLQQKMATAFMAPDLPKIPVENDFAELPWRTWFPDSGVLICRPGPDAPSPFAVAIKGGNNGVNHGHNDSGSFSVVVGTNMVICDPGGEIYTARTFSPHRYDSQVLNSFGHAVPIVAGQLQRTGPGARAVLLFTNFTAGADAISFDLRSAYPVTDLQKLERSFVFQRGPSPSLKVCDDVTFSTPENFESVLITWGKIRRADKNELEISDGGSGVRVSIDTGGRPYHLRKETIDENTENKRKPIHLGIVLDDPVSSAVVTLRISPLN